MEMSVQTEAEEAIRMFNGYRLEERELRVNFARPREERPRGGYDRGGSRNRKRRGGSGSRW